jgi:perosamine synthetase
MPRLAQIVERKRQVARWYLEGLRDVRGLRLPVEREWATNVYWMFCVVVEPDFPLDRDALVARLRERGIDTRNFFLPMNVQPAFRKRGLFSGVHLPVAEQLGRSGFYLPSSSTLDRETIRGICAVIDELSRSG